MDHKSSVLKSKSSNSAITTKSDRSNKKTRSHGEFQPDISSMPGMLKKRGVYVEKKNTKLNLNSLDNKGPVKQGPILPPPRPRRDQKQFLDSVLNILSKNTASTQYPDVSRDPDSLASVEDDKPIRKKLMKRLDVETSEKETQNTLVKKKPKYRSRVLNNMMRKDSKKVVIIQNRQEMTHTPSNYSYKSYKELSDAKYKSLPHLINYECVYKNSNTRKNHGARGKAAAKKQEKLIEPVTLVSENPHKDETGLYNFFVDLLETTFSVYNVKADFNPVHTPSEYDSKMAFEIDENVAKKLCVTQNQSINNDDDVGINDRKKEETPIAKSTCSNKKSYSVNDHIQVPGSNPSTILSKPVTKKRQYKRKLKSKSYFYQKPKFNIISPLQSVIMNKRSFQKKRKKKTFINKLKEQLTMHDCSFEDPQNMHQALKIIARNKRRNKAIHFAEDVTTTDDDPRKECMFKRRKVISSSTKSTKKNYKINKNERKKRKRFRIFPKNLSKSSCSVQDDKTDSYHSLEVHTYIPEANTTRRYFENKNKKILFAKPSSTRIKEEFDSITSKLKLTSRLSSAEFFCSDIDIPMEPFD